MNGLANVRYPPALGLPRLEASHNGKETVWSLTDYSFCVHNPKAREQAML